jgi:general secretion pathway protein N
MPRPLTLIALFLVCVLFFLIRALPAAPFLQKADGLMLAGQPLALQQIHGRIWEGDARWRWGRWRGEANWSTDWRGLLPGLTLDVTGHGMHARGWVGATPGSVRVNDLALQVPLAEISRDMAAGQADGTVTAQVDYLRMYREGRVEVEGTLRYGGGQVTWKDGGSSVPPLDGRLFTEHNVAWLKVTDPQQTLLLDASVEQGEAAVRVYRSWPRLLGVSQGGADDDVVFQVSQPLGG